MLPFFRKMRWRLAADNQFFKYSRYAIGEIVLVVVGILIALYINNWNEERKERERFDLALVEVVKELESNIYQTRTGFHFFSLIDSVYLKVLLDTLSIKTYQEDESQILLNLGYSGFVEQIKDNSFRKLPSTKILSPKQDTILDRLSTLYEFWFRVLKDDRGDYLRSLENNRDLIKKYDWYQDWRFGSMRDKDVVDYFLNNQEYFNSISDSYGSLTQYKQIVAVFDQDAVSIHSELVDYLDKQGIESSDAFFEKPNVDDFKHYIGKYDSKWCNNRFYIHDDSIVVSLEEDKLIYTGYRSDGPDTKMRITPINKYRFKTEGQGGFYHLEYDEEGEVNGIRFSGGPRFILTMEKVQ